MIFLKKIKISMQSGVSFVELLIMTLFLTGIAFSTAFLVARSKLSMKSVSQTGHCPILAKEMLEQFASFGTRLYGYSYDGSLAHQTDHPKTRPLLIMPDNSASPPGIKDVAGHSRATPNSSKLKFPGIFTQTLQELSISMSAGSDGDWVNTGIDIIKMHNNKIELGSSVFIINTINTLQYLYNSDSTYFTGTRQGSSEIWGKMWSTMSSNSALEKYKKQFDLTDLKVYLLIRPVELGMGQHNVLTTEADVANKCQSATVSGNILTATDYTCPQDGSHYLLLTRPRLANDIIRKIPPYVILHGNPHLGFELKVTIEYQKSGSSEDLYCDTMQTFTHQMDSTDNLQEPPTLPLETLVNAAPTPRNLMATPIPIVNPEDTTDTVNKDTLGYPEPEYVSCDTDGSGYDDISLELDLDNLKSQSEKGTLLLCQGVRACLSGDSKSDYAGTSCTYQTGDWRRCHQVTFPGQTTTTKSSLANSKLTLTFEDLPSNRRYDLNLAEMSMSGTISPYRTIARFYIDAQRPQITKRTIKGDDVGGPLDNKKDRNYSAKHRANPGVAWNIPTDVISNKWLQCNQADVEFESTVTDQFTHNLRPCKRTAKRRDGNGTTDQTANLNTLDLQTNRDKVTGTDYKKCHGKLSSIEHGRQTITLMARDSCGKASKNNIVWDTDLPSTFAAQDFASKVIWFKNSKAPSYTIESVLPATGAGTFPKHYSVDCFEEYWQASKGSQRPDGDGGKIACSLTTSVSSINDGCNPNTIGIDYWHVCGGNKQNVETTWGVYASNGESCQNVPCEPDLFCCDNDVCSNTSTGCNSSTNLSIGNSADEICEVNTTNKTRMPATPKPLCSDTGSYDSLSDCNDAKPRNSKCSRDSNNCYKWTCKYGYYNERWGIPCYPCMTGKACSYISKPDEAAFCAGWNGCYDWTCGNGYTRKGFYCEEDDPPDDYCQSFSSCVSSMPEGGTCTYGGKANCYYPGCPAGRSMVRNNTCVVPCLYYRSLEDCNKAKPENSGCSATDDNNNCYDWKCADGHFLIGGACLTSCSYTSSASCNKAKPSHSTCRTRSGICVDWECDGNYTKTGNSCTLIDTDTHCPYSSLNNCMQHIPPSNASCYQIPGTNLNNCYDWSCGTGYRIGSDNIQKRDICVCRGYTSFASCDSSKPDNSSCSTIGSNCYDWSCDTGYAQIGDSCILSD